MSLPHDAKSRKEVPIYSGVLMYFPDAIAAVAEVSRIGNEQHHPGTPLHWDRSKSTDEKDALVRHLLEAGTMDTDGVRHSAKVAWRALANLQKEIERDAGDRDSQPSDVDEIRIGPGGVVSYSGSSGERVPDLSQGPIDGQVRHGSRARSGIQEPTA